MADSMLIVAVVLACAFIAAAHVGRLESHLVEHLDRQVNTLKGFTMSNTQAAVDAVVAQLGKAKAEIVAKIADVQDQLDSVERPEDVDLSALTAAAQSLDDIVPDAPADVPADEPPAEVDGDEPADDDDVAGVVVDDQA